MKQGWEIKKLGEVCKLYQPKTISGEMLEDDGKFLVYGANGVIGRYSQYNHEDSEVLLTCRGATCGSVNVSEPYSWINGNAMVVKPVLSDSITQSFLKYYLTSVDWTEVITGAAQPQITRQSLSPLRIVIPPLPEQEKIVSELDCLSGILEKKRQQLKELDALAQSIFYEMFGDPVTNEREWEVKEIQEIFKVTSSKRILQSEWKENGIPFFKVAEIVALIKGEKINPSVFIDETNYEELCKANLVPTEGDILITSRGTLGQCYIVKKGDRFYFQDGMITWLSPKKNLATPIFTKGVFLNDSFFESLSNIANNSTIAYISIKQLSKMRLILPPLPLQQTFATKIEAIESQKALIKQSLGEVETLFNSRMQEYFG